MDYNVGLLPAVNICILGLDFISCFAFVGGGLTGLTPCHASGAPVFYPAGCKSRRIRASSHQFQLQSKMQSH
jgi:hypothetical protein